MLSDKISGPFGSIPDSRSHLQAGPIGVARKLVRGDVARKTCMRAILGFLTVVAAFSGISSAMTLTFACTYKKACVPRNGCDIAYGNHPGVRRFEVVIDTAARTVDGLPSSLEGTRVAWKKVRSAGLTEDLELDRSTGDYQRTIHRADGTVGMMAWAACRSDGEAL